MPSSVILGMRYQPDMRILTIAFRNRRGTYRYFEVPEAEWLAFRKSGSKGTYLNEVFKSKNYRYEMVGPSEISTGRLAPESVENELSGHENASKFPRKREKNEHLEWGEIWALPKD